MSSPTPPVIAGVSGDQPAAVAYALQEASRLGTSLRVVHCCTEEVAGTDVLRQAKVAVEASSLAVLVDYVLERGEPGSILVEHAQSASALVLGADDGTWFSRMLSGDVSGPLALSAGCPVTLVPRHPASEAPSSGVVVTLDGDTSVPGTLRYGFELSDFRAENLHVLHASPVGTTATDTVLLAERVRHEIARWNAITPDVAARLSLTDVGPLGRCIRATSGASLLVIGRPHGHGHLFALTRPVAMLVLREALCPVAVVPSQYGTTAPVERVDLVGPGSR